MTSFRIPGVAIHPYLLIIVLHHKKNWYNINLLIWIKIWIVSSLSI